MSDCVTEEAQTAPKGKTYDFEKVLDSRGNPIEALWVRNGRFYGQTYVPGKGTRRFALLNERREPVADRNEARAALQALRTNKREGNLPTSGRAPFFADYVTRYLGHIEKRKSPLTVKKERCALGGWADHLGTLRVSQIKLDHINDYTNERLEDGKNNRTVNLDVAALHNLLKFARDENWMRGELPTERWGRLEENPRKRGLLSNEDFDKLLAEALREGEYVNGQLLADWFKLMAYSGARRQSAISVSWADVDFERKQLHLRNNTKFGKHIVVDFNPKLEAHLKEMHSRKAPGNDYLFPGRWETRGEDHLCNMQKTIVDVREKVGLTDFSPHDLRHKFISHCVMDGIDFMTIAKWVGHSDGGILIGKIYGHLSNDHLKLSALKVTNGEKTEPAKPVENEEMKKMQAQLATLTKMLEKQLGLGSQKTSG